MAALYHFDSDLEPASNVGPTLVATGTTPPTVDSGSAKFGGKGLLCSGTGTLVTATSADFAFGTGEFCIEFWVKTPTAGANSSKAMVAISTTGNYDVGMIWVNGQYLAWYGPNSNFVAGYDGTYWDTNWHHIALVRHSGVLKFYFDGVQIANTVNDSTNYSADARLSVGSCGDGSYACPCWIDEVRVTKGSSVYTENFTPPTAAFIDPPNLGTIWNSADKSANITLSNGGLTVTGSGGWSSARAVRSKNTGKRYFEVHWDSGSNLSIGIATAAMSLGSYVGNGDYGGFSVVDWGLFMNGYNRGGTPPTFAVGDVIGVLYDCDTGDLQFSVNGTLSSLFPAPAPTGGTTFYPAIAPYGSAVATARFATASWSYPPSGYVAW